MKNASLLRAALKSKFECNGNRLICAKKKSGIRGVKKRQQIQRGQVTLSIFLFAEMLLKWGLFELC